MCLPEFAMMIFGIVILLRGKCTFSRNIVVTGRPAYAIGIILTGSLLWVVLIGAIVGIIEMTYAGGGPLDLGRNPYIDLVLTPIILLVVVIIVAAFGTRPKGKPVPSTTIPPSAPMDLPSPSENPYASPRPDE